LGSQNFQADRADVLTRARDNGVSLIIEIACEAGDWENALTLCRQEEGRIFCVLGLHPHECGAASPENMARLETLLKSPEVCALGEIGLDYMRCPHPRDKQIEVLSPLLEMAKRTKLPLVFHCRNAQNNEFDAYEDLLDILKSSGPFNGGILHCFSGSAQSAQRAVDMGFLLGVNGTVSYPKNSALREILKSFGPKHLTLETDCPYLPPQSKRGKRNEPALLPEICAALSETLNLPPEETARIAFNNALDVFRLERTQSGFSRKF